MGHCLVRRQICALHRSLYCLGYNSRICPWVFTIPRCLKWHWFRTERIGSGGLGELGELGEFFFKAESGKSGKSGKSGELGELGELGEWSLPGQQIHSVPTPYACLSALFTQWLMTVQHLRWTPPRKSPLLKPLALCALLLSNSRLFRPFTAIKASRTKMVHPCRTSFF